MAKAWGLAVSMGDTATSHVVPVLVVCVSYRTRFLSSHSLVIRLLRRRWVKFAALLW